MDKNSNNLNPGGLDEATLKQIRSLLQEALLNQLNKLAEASSERLLDPKEATNLKDFIKLFNLGLSASDSTVNSLLFDQLSAWEADLTGPEVVQHGE